MFSLDIAVVTPGTSLILTTAISSTATVQCSTDTLRQLSSDTSNPSTSQKILVRSSTPTVSAGTIATPLNGILKIYHISCSHLNPFIGVQLFAIIIGVVFIFLFFVVLCQFSYVLSLIVKKLSRAPKNQQRPYTI